MKIVIVIQIGLGKSGKISRNSLAPQMHPKTCHGRRAIRRGKKKKVPKMPGVAEYKSDCTRFLAADSKDLQESPENGRRHKKLRPQKQSRSPETSGNQTTACKLDLLQSQSKQFMSFGHKGIPRYVLCDGLMMDVRTYTKNKIKKMSKDATGEQKTDGGANAVHHRGPAAGCVRAVAGASLLFKVCGFAPEFFFSPGK